MEKTPKCSCETKFIIKWNTQMIKINFKNHVNHCHMCNALFQSEY